MIDEMKGGKRSECCNTKIQGLGEMNADESRGHHNES